MTDRDHIDDDQKYTLKSEKKPKKKSKSWLAILLIILGSLFILGGIFLFLFSIFISISL